MITRKVSRVLIGVMKDPRAQFLREIHCLRFIRIQIRNVISHGPDVPGYNSMEDLKKALEA